MTGTRDSRAMTVIACPRGCGRRTNLGQDECGKCRKGYPALGEVRECATCGWPMRNALTRRICGSCSRRALWRAGKFALAQLRRGDRWTPEEEAEIRAMAGSHTAEQIGKAIGRSKDAVHCRAHLLGVYLISTDWTMARLCALFNAWEPTVKKAWIAPGLLPAGKLGPREHALYGEWRIREEDIERLILDCPWAYDATRMFPPSHRLTQMALRVQRRDPWITAEEAAIELGMSTTAVIRWCKAGVIPTKRRHVGRRGGVHGQYAIRAADLEAASVAIHDRQRQARLSIQAGLNAFNQRRRALREGIAA